MKYSNKDNFQKRYRNGITHFETYDERNNILAINKKHINKGIRNK